MGGPALRLPLLAPALGWVAGMAAARTDLVPWIGLVCLAGALVPLIYWRRPRMFALAALAGIAYGAVNLAWDAHSVTVDKTWLTGSQGITADIIKVQDTVAYTRLTLKNIHRNDGAALNGLAWLYIHGHAMKRVKSGDAIRARTYWHAPRNHNNPGGFDFAAYCFDRHIALIGSARGKMRIITSNSSWMEHIRQRIRYALAPLPPSRRGVLNALLLGNRGQIPTDVYDAFSASGAAHLLAISGLHVGMAGAIGFALCWWLVTRREAWIIRLPVRGIALLAGTLVAVAYASLADWPLPAERATIMLAAGVLAWWIKAGAAPVNILLAALMLILLWDAQAVESVSLWLSFCATAAILIWAGRPRREGPDIRRWITGVFAVTVLASLATLPLIASTFGRLPVYGLPVNMLMTPLYSLLILPLALAGAGAAAMGLAPVATGLFSLAGYGIEAGNHFLAWVSGWPAGHLWLPLVPWPDTAFYLAGMALAGVLMWRQRRVGAVAVAGVVLSAYVIAAVQERPPDAVRFIAWDVGQGAAASLVTPHGGVMVVDAPGRAGSRFNGGTIVAAGLRALGLTHVDVLAITHAQSDHMGGAARLLQQVNHVRELWLADVPAVRRHHGIQRLIKRLEAQGGMVRWLKRGDQMAFAGVKGQVLWPPAGYAPVNINNASLVLSLRLPGGERLLLPGDIEAEAEMALTDAVQPYDVALMPHHGSNTSSTPAFVRAVKPHIAIAQTGFANRYGFPRPGIVRRYRETGANVWNTAHAATIIAFGGESPGMHARYAAPVRSEKYQRALRW